MLAFELPTEKALRSFFWTFFLNISATKTN